MSATNPNLNPCCAEPSNLVSKDSVTATGAMVARLVINGEPVIRQDIHCHVCKVCGRRHFGLDVDPGVIGR